MSKELGPETLLTVKEASELTNLTIPTFYTAKRKRDLKFNESGSAVWLIKVADLVAAQMLTSDFKPTRGFRLGSSRANNPSPELYEGELNDLKEKVEFLYKEIERIEEERARVQLLADERAKQLDMVNRLISRLELKSDI